MANIGVNGSQCHPDLLCQRQLEAGDYDKGFPALLQQLTVMESVADDIFRATFEAINSSPDYYVCVVEDVKQQRLVACGTVFFERKFIRGCGTVGHIEDVVVDQSCRGMRLGQRVIARLLEVSRERGCYKAILDCSEDNVGFYEKAGLSVKGVQMAKYFDDAKPS